MHEPDKAPDTRIVKEERFAVQWLANSALFCGVITIIGLFLAIASGRVVFLSLTLIGIILAVAAVMIARRVKDERARATAIIAIILNIVLFIFLLFLFMFFKEAAKAAA